MARNLMSSLLLLVGVMGIRFFLIRIVRRIGSNNIDLRKRWVSQVKNLSILILVLGLVVVWASELQAFAISLVAVAAAVVIATKELILCLLGGMVKAVNKPFRIGDRIRVGDFRGDVVDHNIFVTILEEIGPGEKGHQFTGKRVMVPNALFLSDPIVNEAVNRKFSLHVFSIFCLRSDDILKEKSLILEAANSVCGEYMEKAKRFMARVEKDEVGDTPNVAPRVTIVLAEKEDVELIVRVPIPARRSGKIEQKIIESYLKLRTGGD